MTKNSHHINGVATPMKVTLTVCVEWCVLFFAILLAHVRPSKSITTPCDEEAVGGAN